MHVGCMLFRRSAFFACVDPMAPCVDDDSVTVDMLEICLAGEIGEARVP